MSFIEEGFGVTQEKKHFNVKDKIRNVSYKAQELWYSVVENKKKILLLSCSMEDVVTGSLNKFDKTGMKTTDSSGYPLGILYLVSILESPNP